MDGWMDDEVERTRRKNEVKEGREGKRRIRGKEEVVIEVLTREGLQSNAFYTHPNLDMLIPPSRNPPDCLYRYDYIMILYT